MQEFASCHFTTAVIAGRVFNDFRHQEEINVVRTYLSSHSHLASIGLPHLGFGCHCQALLGAVRLDIETPMHVSRWQDMLRHITRRLFSSAETLDSLLYKLLVAE